MPTPALWGDLNLAAECLAEDLVAETQPDHGLPVMRYGPNEGFKAGDPRQFIVGAVSASGDEVTVARIGIRRQFFPCDIEHSPLDFGRYLAERFGKHVRIIRELLRKRFHHMIAEQKTEPVCHNSP